MFLVGVQQITVHGSQNSMSGGQFLEDILIFYFDSRAHEARDDKNITDVEEYIQNRLPMVTVILVPVSNPDGLRFLSGSAVVKLDPGATVESVVRKIRFGEKD